MSLKQLEEVETSVWYIYLHYHKNTLIFVTEIHDITKSLV
jgi:hypothetical protein